MGLACIIRATAPVSVGAAAEVPPNPAVYLQSGSKLSLKISLPGVVSIFISAQEKWVNVVTILSVFISLPSSSLISSPPKPIIQLLEPIDEYEVFLPNESKAPTWMLNGNLANMSVCENWQLTLYS